MKEQWDELLHSNRDGINSSQTEGSDHSRGEGTHLESISQGSYSFEGTIFQGGALSQGNKV